MSHLHIPDGILPPVLWIWGLILTGLLLLGSGRVSRRAGPRQIAFQSALGGIMLAVMAIPVPITAFDYCMTLAGPVGVLLGAAGAFQLSFVVTLILERVRPDLLPAPAEPLPVGSEGAAIP